MRACKFRINDEVAPKLDANWLSPTNTPPPKDGIYRVITVESGSDLKRDYPTLPFETGNWYISTTERGEYVLSSQDNWEKVIPTEHLENMVNEILHEHFITVSL